MSGNKSSSRAWCALPMLLIGAATSVTQVVAAQTEGDQAILFTDITQEAGIDFIETIGDETMSNIVESAGVGCAFVDYDGDGWMDIYLVNGMWLEEISDPALEPETRQRLAGATDRLYRNLRDGTFEDVTAAAGLERPGFGMGVVSADYDGDGDADLFVTNYGPNFLYRNNGDGTFTDVAEAAGIAGHDFSVGAVFFDYDRDGVLDLYVGNYVQFDPNYTYHYAPNGFPGPLAYPGNQDRLYRGTADGVFLDMTAAAGLVNEPVGRAMGVGTIDYDGDGWMDVFVANDAMENFLLRNRGDGTFENRAMDLFVAYGASGDDTAAMAVEVGDVDDDGHFDLFVPDMKYSCLYRYDPGGFFEDLSLSSGIAAACGQYVSWGAVLADFDLDGRLDLYVSNGDAHHLESEEDLLFIGRGTGVFEDISERAGDWSRSKFVSRGAARGDFDNDGDIDLLVASVNDRPVLLRNDSPRNDAHWLGVRLVGHGPNRDAVGAVVRLTVGDRTISRCRLTGGSYLSQHDPRLHFGLGRWNMIQQIEVTWPDGARQMLNDAPADQYLVIEQSRPAKSASSP